MNNRGGCFVAVWQQVGSGAGGLTLARHRKVSDAPGACLDVARNGALLAVGTSEGAAMVRVCMAAWQHAVCGSSSLSHPLPQYAVL